MAIKSKVKLKAKNKAKLKAAGKTKAVIKAKAAKISKSKPAAKAKTSKSLMLKSYIKVKPTTKLASKPKDIMGIPENTAIAKPAAMLAAPAGRKPKNAAAKTAVVKRNGNPQIPRRLIKRSQRANQFTYMKAPGIEHDFEVADTVEVFCDHEKNRERIRGWVKGIVVQVDHKMAAVQFRSNVYLTDGWMVPDRILWYPVNSEHIRAVAGKKIVKKDFIPVY